MTWLIVAPLLAVAVLLWQVIFMLVGISRKLDRLLQPKELTETADGIFDSRGSKIPLSSALEPSDPGEGITTCSVCGRQREKRGIKDPAARARIGGMWCNCGDRKGPP